MEGQELIVTASQSVEDKSRVFQQRFSLPAGVQPHQVQLYMCTCVQVYMCTGVQVYRCTGVQFASPGTVEPHQGRHPPHHSTEGGGGGAGAD